ncbi:PQQ-binding-like beta-propeller repeat protein [Caenimonas sedimenti]|uniref:PQQ-binding-like beta-propeller repeat protein n=1 Tax=Caenimonas sedimenti TaxID=2596921 RepID=A0A562ZXM2_9BURK|nr:PQQ-binding-like beta-propeller repeat protein [Caenimonas sedimenti]TWO73131.1 PQQ-binding-like beta-propeller repeat protein [Caenimonas sedimenti]
MGTMILRFRLVRNLLAGLACALALAGCGGGSGDSSTSGIATASKELLRGFADNGYYWNPAEPGTGFFVEVQGGRAVVTFYLYDGAGLPTWLSGDADIAYVSGANGTYRITGTLQRFTGGQSARSARPVAPTSTTAGLFSVTLQGGKAQVQLASRSFLAERFFAPAGGSATAGAPETGIYWNPAESGRGYTIEAGGGLATVGVFHYREDGQPTWNLVVVSPNTGAVPASGAFQAYRGGQAVSGPYKPAEAVPTQERFGVDFAASRCSGRLIFPDMPATRVERFGFVAGLRASPCTSEFRPAPQAESDFGATLDPPRTIQGSTSETGTVRSEFKVRLNGLPTDEAARALAVVVVDPDGLYQQQSMGVVTKSGFNLTFQATPLKAGAYRGQLQFHVCRDLACTRQAVGSPLVVPYEFVVGTGLRASAEVEFAFTPRNETLTVPVEFTLPARTKRFQLSSPNTRWTAPGWTHSGGVFQVPSVGEPQKLTVLVTRARFDEIGSTNLSYAAAAEAQGSEFGGEVVYSGMVQFVHKMVEDPLVLSPLDPVPGITKDDLQAARNRYLPGTFDAARFTRRFEVDGAGFQQPRTVVVDGGRACMADTSGVLECWSETTGKQLWSLQVRDLTGDSLDSFDLLGNRVHVGVRNGRYELDAATGARLATHPSSGGPIQATGTGIFALHGLSSTVARVDPQTGQAAWTTYVPAARSLPAVRPGLLVLEADGGLQNLDPQTGALRLPTKGPDAYATGNGPVLPDSSSAYVVGFSGLARYDLARNQLAWSAGVTTHRGVPVVADGVVYVTTDKAVEARSTTTGALIWSWPYVVNRISPNWSSVDIAVAGRYLILSDKTGTRAIDVITRTEAWFDPEPGLLTLSPNGLLYLRAEYGRVYVFNLR